MKVQKLARGAIIAAIYVALCLLLAPISYGPVQVRVAEVLTLLPILCPEAVVGVTLGCFVANLFTGVPLDVVVGTLATFAAALCTRRLRNIRFKGLPILASLPPVLFNAVAVGAELTYLYTPAGGVPALLVNMASVGAGQLISCCVLGLPLVYGLLRSPALLRIVAGGNGRG